MFTSPAFPSVGSVLDPFLSLHQLFASYLLLLLLQENRRNETRSKQQPMQKLSLYSSFAVFLHCLTILSFSSPQLPPLHYLPVFRPKIRLEFKRAVFVFMVRQLRQPRQEEEEIWNERKRNEFHAWMTRFTNKSKLKERERRTCCTHSMHERNLFERILHVLFLPCIRSKQMENQTNKKLDFFHESH